MNPPIERRLAYLPSTKAEANQKGAAFLDSLNDACTIETHLQEHQTRRDLLLLGTAAPRFTPTARTCSPSSKSRARYEFPR